MPRPHFPVQGGSRPMPRNGAGAAPGSSIDCTACTEKSAEIERLRGELLKARRGQSRAADGPRMGGSAMMWVALSVCGFGLIFALAAMFRHG